MRGHENIIRMRAQMGVKPAFVFINDYPCETDWFEDQDKFARIRVDGDDLSSLDLRFLVGLRVCITAMTEERAKTLFEMVKAANAEAVASCHVKPELHTFKQDGWAAAWSREAAHG